MSRQDLTPGETQAGWHNGDGPLAPSGPTVAAAAVGFPDRLGIAFEEAILGSALEGVANSDIPQVEATSVRPQSAISGQHSSDDEAAWNLLASIPAEVIKSSGVALRRMGDADLASVAITSTAGREGRTTVALGFAAATCAQGRTAILLDLDISNRDIQRLLPVKSAPGVVEFMHGEASIDQCLQPAGECFEVVTAGLADSGSDTRLDRLADLVRTLRDRCDLLVADLPPLEAGLTAARVADLFDSVALVVRAGAVTVPAIERAVSVLRQRPHVILNDAGKRRRLTRLFGGRS
jgi:Mrp family chromosome partitioning ATPase